MPNVDPKVAALASDFIDQTLREVWVERPEKWHCMKERFWLVNRVACAMQEAIDDECEAIRQELLV